MFKRKLTKDEQRQVDYVEAAKRLYSSEDGIFVLAYEKDLYVNQSALATTVELTYYKLGQKELVENRIAAASQDAQQLINSFNLEETYE